MGSLEYNDKLMVLAMRYYDNPHCFHLEDFIEDFNRIQSIKRILNKFVKRGQIKERLIINQLVIMYNCFGEFANNIIFSILPKELYSYIKPFIEFLNRNPDIILDINNKIIIFDHIESNKEIIEIIKKL